MRAFLLLTTAFCLVLSSTAYAQMGGGMGGMGGGRMGGGGRGGGGKGGHRGGGSSRAPGTTPDARPAAAVLSAAMRLKGLVTIAGETKTLTGTITSDKADMSAVYAMREANVTLDRVSLITTGASSLVSDSHAFGINSALLIDTAAKVRLTGGKITTEGQGANAAYVTGDETTLALTDASLATDGTGAYGIDVLAGAGLEATNTTITTGSDHAPAIAAEAGARPVRLSGGTFTTQGPSSPALSLSADLDATGITAASGRAEGAMITGHHRISFTDSDLSAQGYGVMIYEASHEGRGEMPRGEGFDPSRRHGPGAGGPRGGAGPAPEDGAAKGGSVRPVTDMLAPPPEQGPGIRGLQITGGKLSGQRAVFYVTNIRAHIALDHVAVSSASGILLKSAADQWGELGRNGGDAVLEVHHQNLTGDFVTDAISHIAVNLTEDSHLTGKATSNTDITLDSTSTWTLTADSSVGKLTADPSQIDSQGHTLNYDKFRNPALNEQTLPLPGGGQLVPSGL